MKLCVNYLEETKELLEEGKIDFIDYIKLFSINGDYSPIDWCITKKEVMFHGIIGEHESNIGEVDFMEGRDIEEQKRIFAISKTPYLSSHINARYGNIPSNSDEALAIILKNVEKLRECFHMEIALENIPAYPINNELCFYAIPEFITKVITESGCHFLFDIGHARVAADRLHIPFEEYVERLPMDKLIEMHLAGCMQRKDGVLLANHSKMHEEDYLFLEKWLSRSQTLQVVTLEYGPIGKDITKLPCPYVEYGTIDQQAKKEVLEQLLRLQQMIRK